MMKLLTLKNRTSESFTGMYDGVSYTIQPGASVTLLDFIALHLKNQSICRLNPVMGDAEFRLAIVEHGDDDSPLYDIPDEVLDRSDMDLHKTRIVKMGNRPAVPVHRAAGSAVTAKERDS
jgi:hypothetical protein